MEFIQRSSVQNDPASSDGSTGSILCRESMTLVATDLAALEIEELNTHDEV